METDGLTFRVKRVTNNGCSLRSLFFANCDSHFKEWRKAVSLKSLKIKCLLHKFFFFFAKDAKLLSVPPSLGDTRHITMRMLIKFHSRCHLRSVVLQTSGRVPPLDCYQNPCGDGCCCRKSDKLLCYCVLCPLRNQLWAFTMTLTAHSPHSQLDEEVKSKHAGDPFC